ncbi:transporter [Geomicrobium sp. JCM 19055]|nr:transporter [Geomicrobium sp. JCM 19055]
MMSEFGIEYMRAAENIAMGQQTSEQVMDGWMNSDGHRQNILDPELTHIGVGYEEDGNYWTQMFISE